MTIRRFAPTRPIAVVAEDRQSIPAQLCWRGRWEKITAIAESWNLTHGWWKGDDEAVQRRYYRVLTHSGLLCVIYHDPAPDVWYIEQIID